MPWDEASIQEIQRVKGGGYGVTYPIRDGNVRVVLEAYFYLSE